MVHRQIGCYFLRFTPVSTFLYDPLSQDVFMKLFFAPCLVLASMLGTTFAHAASMPVDTNARFKLGFKRVYQSLCVR